MEQDDNAVNPKVSGYLEKKGKMKMMSSYKRYWFVLEGRLLLYYRSKDEYEGISPCKGSINLGPPCNIKPCPSTNGLHVFQIETRSTTITLRAESQEDQNRWMQGIISALNQNLNNKKLSHFRYSLDEIPQKAILKGALNRKNTIPPHTDIQNIQSNKEETIIQRLQKIGAQSYGGSMDALNQKINRHTSKNETVCDTSNTAEFRSSVLIENDQYGMVNKAVSVDNIELRKGRCVIENIYERISNGSSVLAYNKENTYSVPNKTKISCAESLLKDTGISRHDAINDDTTDTENKSRPTTFLLENETYGGVHQNGMVNNGDKRSSEMSFMESNHYYDIGKGVARPNKVSEVIYAEPKCKEITDHNENNLVVNKAKGEANAYSVTKLYESERNSVNSTQYEDLEKYVIYTETKSQTECTTNKSKLKKEKNKKQCKDKTGEDKKCKVKKSSSFIRRVWRKKVKHKGKDEDIEEIYEFVPDPVVDKLTLTDDAAVQMLSELQNILEHKKPVLLERTKSHNDETKPESESRTSSNENPNSPVGNLATIQMLSELQSILKDKQTTLSVRSGSETESPTPDDQIQNKNTSDISSCSSKSEKICPTLPPRREQKDVPSSFHDVPNNNQLVQKNLPPKKRQSIDDNLSLDEILDDLNKEKCEDLSKCKVKKLIKQFSESDIECDVELRKNKKPIASREDSDSNELNKLLDELTKVTYAPILTPGVTSSLVSPNLTDEELIKLLPSRRRRYSDPDYDVPRPHKSLLNLPKEEVSPENVIGSTRFFGPILASDSNDRKRDISKNVEDSPQPLSITPDSLEPELVLLSKCAPMPRLWEDDKISYSSHSYIQFRQPNNTSNIQKGDDPNKQQNILFENSLKDLYSRPKSLQSRRIMKIQKDNETIKRLFAKETSNDNVEDVSVDSLEIGT